MTDTAIRPLVLVVEDDEVTRMDAVVMIRDAGFDVIEAATADQAITILETRLNIAVVFTDIEMPGSLDGMRLAHAIRNRWPPIKVVATSGHFDMHGIELPKDVRFLPKPYVLAAVTRTLQDITARN